MLISQNLQYWQTAKSSSAPCSTCSNYKKYRLTLFGRTHSFYDRKTFLFLCSLHFLICYRSRSTQNLALPTLLRSENSGKQDQNIIELEGQIKSDQNTHVDTKKIKRRRPSVSKQLMLGRKFIDLHYHLRNWKCPSLRINFVGIKITDQINNMSISDLGHIKVSPKVHSNTDGDRSWRRRKSLWLTFWDSIQVDYKIESSKCLGYYSPFYWHLRLSPTLSLAICTACLMQMD